jgi:heme exporter protein B
MHDPHGQPSLPLASFPGFWRQLACVAGNQLRLQWRGRAQASAMLCFAALTLFLFSFAVGPQQALLARVAPGFVWLAILLASTLSLGESMRQEVANGALEGQLLLGVDPMAIFLGKAMVNALFLFCLGQVVVPVAIALYDAPMRMGPAYLSAALALGTCAISAPGTLFAALATLADARDLLMPLLLFPVLVPGLLAAVKATSVIMLGDPMGECHSWLVLLVAFNALFWPLCTALFGRVVE